MKSKSLRGPRATKSYGFSLTEILVVISVISILAVLSTPALLSLSGAAQLTRAADMVNAELAQARTMAITQRTLVRFSVVESWPSRPDYNYLAFALLKLDPTQSPPTWIEASKWNLLPPSVIFDPGSLMSVSGANSTQYNFAQNMYSFAAGSESVKAFYIEFKPDGTSDCANPFQVVRLAEGVIGNNGLPVDRASSVKLWAEIFTDQITGTPHTIRP